MRHPLLFVMGYAVIRIPRDDAARAVNALGAFGVSYRNFDFSGDFAYLECSFISMRRALRVLERAGISASVERRCGIPALIYRYRHRYGIAVGVALALLIILASPRFLWDVRIISDTEVDEEALLLLLEENGLYKGRRISEINTPVIENLTLIESEDVAWISINILGCVAEVQVRGGVENGQETEYLCADLVATKDGVIEWFEETRGNALVGIGERVSEGDVIVSGYYPADEESGTGDRYTVAKGRVFARTERFFSVSVPIHYEKKQYTGREKCEKYLILFKKEVKFFGNCGNLYANCDTIDTVEYFELPGGVTLPFGVRTRRAVEYEMAETERSAESAVEYALYRLRCLMEDATPDGMLIKKQITAELLEESYELVCRAEYIENIAAVRERRVE